MQLLFLKITLNQITMKNVNYISPEIKKVVEFMVEGVICVSGYAVDSDDVELF